MPELLQRWNSAEDGEIFETEYRMLHKSGEWRTFLGRDTVFERHPDGRVRSIIGTAQDITHRLEAEAERRRLEAQVLHAQKLESLGVLAGGIAHDFNNLLASILTYADLALQITSENSPAAEYLNNVIDGAQNAAELTRQMLAYSGKGNFELREIDLSRVVADTSRLLQVSISKRCHLQRKLAQHLPTCNGDVSQLRQVVMNLVINASEAIGDNVGTITISVEAQHIDVDGQQIDFSGQSITVGDYVVLTVEDDGCGMDEHTTRKLFDPFFSTKFSGRGLGMSTVLGVVRGHHGAIQVDSTPGEGSKFRVWLPASPKSVSQATAVDKFPVRWSGKGRILLADDEESVRNSISLLLRTLGFEVVTATNGKEAVELFSAQPAEFDIVLMDLTMPVMDGSEACRQIEELRSATSIILMSGYNQEYSHNQTPECSTRAFLHKPFRIDDLKSILARFTQGGAA